MNNQEEEDATSKSTTTANHHQPQEFVDEENDGLFDQEEKSKRTHQNKKNTSQHQHHNQSSPKRNNTTSMMPLSAHAAAFMLEMYASNLHEQMLAHRHDLLRGMSSILRERVAFEKAAEEIRKAETFAVKSSAVRVAESSRLAQENADLRFELEEAYAAVERQKQITENVSLELATMKSQYEQSQMTFQSLGSPLANQQIQVTTPHHHQQY